MTDENEDAACTPTSNWRVEGERSLVRAVLKDAIHCLLGEVGGPPAERVRLAAEARAWITNRSDAAPFAFENVCTWLDLPAKRLREFLLQQAASEASSTPIFGRERNRPSRATGGEPDDIAGGLGPDHLSSELEGEVEYAGHGDPPAAACS